MRCRLLTFSLERPSRVWGINSPKVVLPPKKRTRNTRFYLLCRRNRVTLSPEPPGIFRFRLAPAGAGPWAGGLPVRGHTRRLQGCIGARGASPQSSILRCGVETLGWIAFNVNNPFKLCFIFVRRLVFQRAV